MKVGDVDINYILANYGFVLPVGKSTTDEFVKEIKSIYDCNQPRNKFVVEFIGALKGIFFCSQLGGMVTYIQYGGKV